MGNLTITALDYGSIILQGGEFKDDLLTLGGAVTVLEGTILARDSVSLKLVPFVKGGATNENGIPKAVLTYPITSTGAGDVPVRALIAGEVREERLVIDADGDNSNVDNKVLDQLRAYGITPASVTDLGLADNS